ncbi:MAG: GGDEF domain-containing protein, partial [Pseudomonadota bacterium]
LDAARLWAVSYLCGAIAFSIDMTRADVPLAAAVWTTNAFYLASAGFFTAGHFARRGKPMPFGALAACAATVLLVFIAFRSGEPNTALRMSVLQLVIGVVLSLPIPFLLARTRRGMKRMLVDRVAGWILVAFVLQFWLRAALLASGVIDQDLTEANYFGSIAAMTLRIAITTMAITSAVVLYVMLGIELVSDLHRRSRTDGLTQLLNKTSFEEDAAELLASKRRAEWPISMIVCDLDHFKSVNDTHGHGVGDKVIAHFAKLILDSVRESDLCGRVGGEEFCVLLRGCGLSDAASLAETIRTRLNEGPVPGTDGLCVTASFGVGTAPLSESYSELFERTDAALYGAKQQGRDRVTLDEQGSHQRALKLVA